MTAAGVVLAGGRSSRMGTPKAELEWHGSTLLRRVAGLVARGTAGPLVVVRAPGQELPPLPAGIEVAEDAEEGRGPLEGMAAGLRAVGDRAEVAFLSSTDAPLLRPAFVREVVAALGEEDDVALPYSHGRPHFLAAAYRTSVLAQADELLAAGTLRVGALIEVLRVRPLDAPEALVLNLNDPAAYEAARSQPAPEVTVDGVPLRAATLGAAADLSRVAAATVDGVPVALDPEEPLAGGEAVELRFAVPGHG